jgi:hypothetical protein
MSELDTLLSSGGPLVATRTALDERLKAIFDEDTFTHDFVSARLSTAEWHELVRRAPLVALGWGGLNPKENTGRLFHGRSEWTVVLAVKNEGGALPLHVGDALGHGLFHVVQAAVAGLHGMNILDVGVVEVTGASNLVVKDLEAENIGLVGVDLRVATSVPPMLNRDDFTTSAATWSFPEAGDEPVEQTLSSAAQESEAP